MFYIALAIWAVGALSMTLGFLFFSTSEERKHISGTKMVLAYLFWPITLIAAIFEAFRSRRSR